MIMFYPHFGTIGKAPILAGALVVWSSMVSFLPNAVENYVHLGDATGLSVEPMLKAAPPVDRLVGNSVVIALDNLYFPGLSFYKPFQTWLDDSPVGKMIEREFVPDILVLYPYCAVEQEGLGFVVVFAGAALGLLSLHLGWPRRFWRQLTNNRSILLLQTSIWVLLIAFMLSGTPVQPARLVSGYYPFLLTTFFLGGVAPRRFLGRIMDSVACFAILGVLFCITFASENPLVVLFHSFEYRSMEEQRQERFLEIHLPATERRIGIIRLWNELESWSWRPYGSRQVVELPDRPDPAKLAARDIHYVIVTEHFLADNDERIEEWDRTNHAKFIALCHIQAGHVLLGYYLVRLE